MKVLLLSTLPLIFMSCVTMERTGRRYTELAKNCEAEFVIPHKPIGEEDLMELPDPVRRYFRYSQVVGKPRPRSFTVVMEGRIRNGPDSPWMDISMEQYNRLDAPARVAYIRAPKQFTSGVDSFVNGDGRMRIKILNALTVVDNRSPEMALSSLVTFLNDLVLCPTGYFSLPVRWREVNANQAELSLEYRGMRATALVSFDNEGRIVDWQSKDRYADVKGKNVRDRWSTPFKGQQNLAGLRIPAGGVGIHDYDGKPFVYVELDRIHSLNIQD